MAGPLGAGLGCSTSGPVLRKLAGPAWAGSGGRSVVRGAGGQGLWQTLPVLLVNRPVPAASLLAQP